MPLLDEHRRLARAKRLRCQPAGYRSAAGLMRPGFQSAEAGCAQPGWPGCAPTEIISSGKSVPAPTLTAWGQLQRETYPVTSSTTEPLGANLIYWAPPSKAAQELVALRCPQEEANLSAKLLASVCQHAEALLGAAMSPATCGKSVQRQYLKQPLGYSVADDGPPLHAV